MGDNPDNPILSLAFEPDWIFFFAVTLPNYITFSRIVAVPLFMWLVLTPRLSSITGEKEVFAALVFIAASITDGIDGYLARRRGQVTTLGMLLDPLADKLLVTAALVTLVQFNPTLLPAWIAVLVIGREFLVSGLRSIASTEGFTIEASDLGKYKMFTQIVAVVAGILDHRWRIWDFHFIIIPVHWIALGAVWAMLIMAVWSAVDYFIGFWSKIDRQSAKRRRRAFVLSRRKGVPAAGRQPTS